MSNTAIILAAGMGSRLAEHFSKPLIEVAGQSLLARTVAACRIAGADHILVVTGFRAELVEREVQRLSRGDLAAVYNPDWERANGMSLLACRDRVANERFALMMSDHIFDPTILGDLFRLQPSPDSVTLAVDRKIHEVFDLDDATKVRIQDGHIVAIGKTLADYNAIDCGLFLCTQAIFTALAAVVATRGDASLSEGMARIGQANQFFPFDIGERWWQDVDTPEMLQHATAVLARAARA